MMHLSDVFQAAQSFGYMEKYFNTEPSSEDFWELSSEGYQALSEEDRRQKWFTIDPKKLHKKVLLENNVVIVSEMEKGALLTAFQILRAYSKELPEEAHFKERLLVAKQQLPPVFFD